MPFLRVLDLYAGKNILWSGFEKESLDKGINWKGYLKTVLALLRPYKKEIYIKKGLQAFAAEIQLFEDETDAERYIFRACNDGDNNLKVNDPDYEDFYKFCFKVKKIEKKGSELDYK